MKINLSILVFLLVFCGASTAGASDAVWKVGRAKIEVQADSGGQKLHLRLSLRNEGKPGKVSLEIKGRWGKSGENPKPTDFKKLGVYTQEVALKQTAILMISLESLGSEPKDKPPLELVLLTGSKETDRQSIPLP